MLQLAHVDAGDAQLADQLLFRPHSRARMVNPLEAPQHFQDADAYLRQDQRRHKCYERQDSHQDDIGHPHLGQDNYPCPNGYMLELQAKPFKIIIGFHAIPPLVKPGLFPERRYRRPLPSFRPLL